MPDFKDVWKEALDAALGKVKKKAPEAQQFVRDIAESHKQSLRALLSVFADGKIDEATFESELADEKLVLTGELLALEAMTKKAAQDAANAFMDVIEGAATKALGGLI